MGEQIKDIGEEELIQRLKKFTVPGHFDDDTADIDPKNQQLLINTDLLVENVHFNEQTLTAEEVGWKAITTNLSDLASSGLDKVIGITVGLTAPPQTEWNWIEGVYRGINDALQTYGGALLGGDCSRGTEKVLAITAIGTLGHLRLHRSNSKPGDLIIASGPHGLSKLGLSLLLDDSLITGNSLSEDVIRAAYKAHKTPRAPTEALKALIESKPKDTAWRAAGTDSSDGLFDAIHGICKSSKCQAVLDHKNLPIMDKWPPGAIWESVCLYGGEDYELIITVCEKWAHSFINNFPKAKIIGKMKEGPSNIIWKDGNKVTNNLLTKYSHF